MGVKSLFVIYTFSCIGYCLLIWLCWKISASTAQKYISINFTRKDDLSITCSITNSDQLAELHLIELQRKKNNKFETVISINRIGIVWKDEFLKNRATANGSIEEAELRLFIDRVQCFTDFTEYRCYMEGILNPTQNKVPEKNDAVTWSYSDTCTCMYINIKYDKSYSIEAVWGFIEWYSKERNVCAFYQAI